MLGLIKILEIKKKTLIIMKIFNFGILWPISMKLAGKLKLSNFHFSAEL